MPQAHLCLYHTPRFIISRPSSGALPLPQDEERSSSKVSLTTCCTNLNAHVGLNCG